jgi:hypothetical protein
VDECRYILLHCSILCSQLSFIVNMKKKTLVDLEHRSDLSVQVS